MHPYGAHEAGEGGGRTPWFGACVPSARPCCNPNRFLPTGRGPRARLSATSAQRPQRLPAAAGATLACSLALFSPRRLPGEDQPRRGRGWEVPGPPDVSPCFACGLPATRKRLPLQGPAQVFPSLRRLSRVLRQLLRGFLPFIGEPWSLYLPQLLRPSRGFLSANRPLLAHQLLPDTY